MRDTLSVARDLLGRYMVRGSGRGRLVGKIVEVEAYPGEGDPASHSYRGETARNSVMFGRGGHLYVYFTYGMHFCANVVTGKKGEGAAVLIRAVEPVEGRARMLRNRGLEAGAGHPRLLTGGPARVCQAFGLTKRHNGANLAGPEITLLGGEPVPDSAVAITSRIGISTAKGKKWRFYVRGNPYVSR
jgi:DNA-3-methyladenine glycosylase